MGFFLPFLIAASATALGFGASGCAGGEIDVNEKKQGDLPPPCNYQNPKDICTLTFKPAGPTQVEMREAGQVDQFISTETELS
ncbi:MAG: hypothetical protein JNK65_03480, partial [Deltaproteobacteria bacterium]|nr:hypothetical protein [Deltaproteobacteria bacterium]